MRVEVKKDEKKGEGLGLGLLLAIGAAVGVGYMISSPTIAAHLPPTMERALTKMRADIDKQTEGVRHQIDGFIQSVAGR